MLDKTSRVKYNRTMIRLYRKISPKRFEGGREYLKDMEADNSIAEFETKEEIFALFQEEGHMVNSIEDLINMGVHFETTPE